MVKQVALYGAIGERLFVSENTVKTRSWHLFEKMQVKRRVQAVQKGKDLRLIPLIHTLVDPKSSESRPTGSRCGAYVAPRKEKPR